MNESTVTAYLLFLWLLSIALRIICVYICFQPGGVLFWLRNMMDNLLYTLNVPEWVEKPLYAGLACMASFWGTLFLLKDYYLGLWPTDYLMALVGMLVILGNFVNQKPE